MKKNKAKTQPNMRWIVAGLNPVNGIPTLSILIIGSAIQYSYGREKNNEYPVHIRGGSRGGAPPKIEKKKIFGRKIVIFQTKYPKNFRASNAGYREETMGCRM
jgi:hypothetical protein